MSAPLCLDKRWQDRAPRWVAPGEVFDARRYSVDLLPDDTRPKRFVAEHHYSGTYPAARLAVGLFGPRGGEAHARLVGVAVFSVPMTPRVLTKHAAGLPGCELGRFVLLPEIAYNGETWLLVRACRLLADDLGVRAVVSMADPLEWRHGALVVKPAHWGTIYQAANALYVGRSTPRTHLVGPDGRPISPRALSKLRAGDQGRAYAERQLLATGAPARAFGETPRDWLRRLVNTGALTRQRHPGNHVYVFGLDADARATLRAAHGRGLPYPKKRAAAAEDAPC